MNFMKNLFTRAGGGGISLKSSQGANFALEDKGALGSNLSGDTLLGLENFGWASKTRHLKSTLDAQHILPCHCEECVSTTSQRISVRMASRTKSEQIRIASRKSGLVAKPQIAILCERGGNPRQSYDIGLPRRQIGSQ